MWCVQRAGRMLLPAGRLTDLGSPGIPALLVSALCMHEVLDNYQFMCFVECLSVSAACVLCRLPGECVAPAPEPWPHPADSGFLPPFQTCFLGAPSQSLDPSRVLRPC